MAYDAATPADKDRVRFLIRDTKAATGGPEMLTDDELVNILLPAAGGNIFGAAVIACLSLAADAARHAVMWEVMGRDFAVDKRAIPREFRLLAEQLKVQADALCDPLSISWGDENIVQLLDGGIVLGGLHDYQHIDDLENT